MRGSIPKFISRSVGTLAIQGVFDEDILPEIRPTVFLPVVFIGESPILDSSPNYRRIAAFPARLSRCGFFGGWDPGWSSLALLDPGLISGIPAEMEMDSEMDSEMGPEMDSEMGSERGGGEREFSGGFYGTGGNFPAFPIAHPLPNSNLNHLTGHLIWSHDNDQRYRVQGEVPSVAGRSATNRRGSDHFEARQAGGARGGGEGSSTLVGSSRSGSDGR